jgi:protein-S-isoprenylcysteine O-methyltransferase Ste14
MSLSAYERRALAEIERALMQEDPHLFEAVSNVRPLRPARRWLLLGLFLAVVGGILLGAGIVVGVPSATIAGTMVLVACLVVTAWAGRTLGGKGWRVRR